VGDALVSLLLAAFAETEPGRMGTATELVDRISVYAPANISDPSLSVGLSRVLKSRYGTTACDR